MRTVYVVVKGGIVQEAYADHLTDVVVLDLDTQDDKILYDLEDFISILSIHGASD